MSEHVWVQENIAAFLVGGLEPDEREQLERHLADCAACAGTAEEARSLDRRLRPLLAAGNPGPALEDRLIHSLRSKPTRRHAIRWTATYKLILGSAAALLLALLGVGVSELMSRNVLDFPGTAERVPVEKFPYSHLVHGTNYHGPNVNTPTEGQVLVETDKGRDEQAPPESASEGKTFSSPSLVLRSLDNPTTQETVKVLVSKKKLDTGTRVRNPEELFEFKDISLDVVPKDAITDFKDLEGRVLRVPQGQGVWVTNDQLVSKDVGGVGPPVGLRAIGVKVNNESTASGWLSLPNSRVDLVLNRRKGNDKASSSQVLLQNVLVLGTDDRVNREDNGKPMSGPVVILGLTPEDALKVDVARSVGSLSMMLRPNGDDKRISPRKITAEEVDAASGLTKSDEGKYFHGRHFDMKDVDFEKENKQVAKTVMKEETRRVPLTVTRSMVETITKNGKTYSVPRTVAETVYKNVVEQRSKGSPPTSTLAYVTGAQPGSEFKKQSEIVWKSATNNELPPIPRPKQEDPMGGPPGNNPNRAMETTNLPGGHGDGEAEKGKLARDPTKFIYLPPVHEIASKGPNPKDKGEKAEPDPAKPQAEDAKQPAAVRKIIRTGEIEFEVDSFDGSYATIMRLINATKGSFLATSNSEKLSNGKMRGSIVVRIPPELLDNFVLDLRKELAKVGELKSQRIGSEDVSKHYSDLDSLLRAARTMEERLLAIIKTANGQIKDLVMAEKELGVYRTQIEQIEGELRYYNNLVSLSKLTITLVEKDIRLAGSIIESEVVQAGIETEDVEKARQVALKAIEDVKGRVSLSKLEQLAAGKFIATLHFEVTFDAAGPMRDRLKQLGTMARLQIDRKQKSDNGPPAKDGKIERGNTKFEVSLYNLATALPRETVLLRIATNDVKAMSDKLREAVQKAEGHLLNAEHDGKDPLNIHAQLDFDLRRPKEGEVQPALIAAGELLSRQVNRVPEGDNFTDAKVCYRVTLLDLDSVEPRETITMKIAAPDVRAAHQKLLQALPRDKTRIINNNLDEADRRNVIAQIDFSFNRTDKNQLDVALKDAGETLTRLVARAPAGANVTDTKLQAKITLVETDSLTPRETVNVTIAAEDVNKAYETLRAVVAKAKGRTTHADCDEKDRRNVTAELHFAIPRGEEPAFQRELTNAGETLSRKVTRQQDNAMVTDVKVGYQLTITSSTRIPPRETATLTLEVADVGAALTTYEGLVTEAKGRTVETQPGPEKNGQATVRVTYDVPFNNFAGLVEKIKPAGKERGYLVNRDLQAPEGKLALGRLVVILKTTDLSPRETVTMTIGADDVPKAFEALRTAIVSAKGRTTHVEINEQDRHNVTAVLQFDIPGTEKEAFKRELESAGKTLARKMVRQQETGNVTDARVGYKLEIAPAYRSDEGLWPQIGSGLSFSLRGLFISLNFLLLGVLFVLPWLLMIGVVFLVVRRVLGAAKK